MAKADKLTELTGCGTRVCKEKSEENWGRVEECGVRDQWDELDQWGMLWMMIPAKMNTRMNG